MNPIHRLKCRYGFFCALITQIFLYPSYVPAQFVPGPYYYPDAGVMGAISSAYQSAAQQQDYIENRQMQMQSSMARSAAWQSINRSMQTEALSRPDSVPDSGQAARDWMFQQNVASRSIYSRKPVSLPSVAMTSSEPEADPNLRPTAPKEIMLWPTILKDPLFNDDRAEVKAPFRRAYSDGKPLSVADYEGIIKAVERIKISLKSFESQLVESEYNSTNQYLDSLISDAQKRIQARKAEKE